MRAIAIWMLMGGCAIVVGHCAQKRSAVGRPKPPPISSAERDTAEPAQQGGAVDFEFEIRSERARLSDLRGRPLLLVVVRTSDLTSQLFMREVVKAFERVAGALRFLVVTIEPNDGPFVELYVEAEQLPFPIAVAEPDVGLGRSALGVIPVVPSTYVIDAQGNIEELLAGAVPYGTLVDTGERAAR